MANDEPRPSSLGAAPARLPRALQSAFAAADYLVAKLDDLVALLRDLHAEPGATAPWIPVIVRGIIALERNERRAARAIRRVTNELTATNHAPSVSPSTTRNG